MNCNNLFVDDLELLMDKCGKEGRQKVSRGLADCEHFNEDGIITKNKQYCRMSYQIACLQSVEDLQCSEGEKFAQNRGKCDEKGSEVFKVKAVHQFTLDTST